MYIAHQVDTHQCVKLYSMHERKINEIEWKMSEHGFKKHVQRTIQLQGQTSYVAPEANFTYAADLFFITKPEDLENKIGLLAIYQFNGFCSLIMLKSKTPEVMLPALQHAFVNLGGTPRAPVSDPEGA